MEPDDTREWYYELEGVRKGPVSERRLRADFERDVLTSETLVWTSGLEDWAPLGSIQFSDEATAQPVELSDSSAASELEDPIVTCAFSGEQHPESQMLPFGESWVTPEHRDAFVQHLAESGDSPDVPLEGFPFPTTFTLETVFGQCFRIFGAQWKAIAIFCVSLYGPCYLVVEFLNYRVFNQAFSVEKDGFATTSLLGSIWGPVFFGIGVEIFLGSFVAAGLFVLTKDRWEGKSEKETGDLIREGAQRFLPVLGTRLLLFLLYFAIGGILGVLIFAAEGISMIFPVAAVTFVLFAFLGTRLTSAEALSVILGKGGNPALQSSWALTQGSFWKVLGYRILLFIPLGVVGGVISLIVEIPTPLLQNLVTSAILSTLIAIPTAFTSIFEMVLAIHLKAKPAVAVTTK